MNNSSRGFFDPNILLKEGLESFLVVRSAPFGNKHLQQVFESVPLKHNQWGEALYNLVQEMQKGLSSEKPALFIIYFDPLCGIQCYGSSIVRKTFSGD